MTPEERARKLLSMEIPEGMDDAFFGEVDEYLFVRITQALRQAEDAAYERAARYLGSPVLSTGNEDLARGFRLGLESAALSCRSLKSEQGT